MIRLLSLSVGLMLLACGGGHGPGIAGDPPAQDSHDRGGTVRIHLDLGESAEVGDEGSKIVFAAVQNDSRCPANVQCPWMGNGRVRLDLVDAHGGVTRFELNTSTEPRGAVVRGLRIDLLDLQPHPEEPGSVPPDGYSVTLAVTEP